MHLTNLLSTYHVPDMILDSENVEMNKDKPSLYGKYIEQLTCLYLEGKGFYKWKNRGKEIWVTFPRWQLVNSKPGILPKIL